MYLFPSERSLAVELVNALRLKTGTLLHPDDEDRLRRILLPAIGGDVPTDSNAGAAPSSPNAEESPLDRRDAFGLHPVIKALQTGLLAVEEMSLRRDGLIATVLSPLVLHGLLPLDSVEQQFGHGPRNILHGLLRIQELYRLHPTIPTSAHASHLRDLLLSFAEDMRVILIMIANRLVVMRAIRDTGNLEARQQVAAEAGYLYAPLAHKLGLYTIKSELEDLSLKYLSPEPYYHIKEKLASTKEARDRYIDSFIGPVRQRLQDAGLQFHIKGRTKSIHSIYQKMKKQRCPFEGVYDLFAIRIILHSPPEHEKMDCWQAYSIVTDMYQPNPKRLRDWLSVPKSNGYESLHITVLGPENKWVEVQIRTERMDEIAEHGLAAHWRYKGVNAGGGMDEWLSAIRTALEAGDDMQMMDSLRNDLYEDEVYVFTPKGEIRKFPKGATVLDFAYQIHSQVGNKCVGATINGRGVQIREQLRSGDTIHIQTSSQQTPHRDWLNIVKTSHAKSKIKKALNELQAREAALRGETPAAPKDEGAGKSVTALREADVKGPIEPATISAANFSLRNDTDNDVLVIDRNLKDIDYSLAKCCNPIYGDNIFGFVTVSGGIKIHRMSCPNAAALRQRFGYRIVPARWSGKGESKYDITLQAIGNDDISIISTITSLLTKEGNATLRSLNIDTGDGLFKALITVRLSDTTQLHSLIRKLRTVKGIKDIQRK
ncbi:MAG: bifunctional (p)ppGpp synthetase/guanosine-3',5'-bis(diphosphate) 3'-pyrophosphohydrolase [Prevotella sp.]|nr:bifunctional (p)ppGpp synthetase/guanosine-3',5'-bis(diphosphate) 3'-pyrophosphohydrolase [Prevotella sp.]